MSCRSTRPLLRSAGCPRHLGSPRAGHRRQAVACASSSRSTSMAPRRPSIAGREYAADRRPLADAARRPAGLRFGDERIDEGGATWHRRSASPLRGSPTHGRYRSRPADEREAPGEAIRAELARLASRILASRATERAATDRRRAAANSPNGWRVATAVMARTGCPGWRRSQTVFGLKPSNAIFFFRGSGRGRSNGGAPGRAPQRSHRPAAPDARTGRGPWRRPDRNRWAHWNRRSTAAVRAGEARGEGPLRPAP